MEIQIQPMVTMNVGDAQSTAASAITYTAYETTPMNPSLGDFRLVPNRVVNQQNAIIEWYDPDKSKWTVGVATVYDRALAVQLLERVAVPNDYVYYRLNVNNTGPSKVIEGDTRKPSFAIDHDQGE